MRHALGIMALSVLLAGCSTGLFRPAGQSAPEDVHPQGKGSSGAGKTTPSGSAPRAEPHHEPGGEDPNQERIAGLYDEGVAALKSGNFDRGLRNLEAVWELDPLYADVAELIKNEYQVRGLEAYSRRNVGEAIRLWERALEIDPKDNKTLAYLSHAKQQMKRLEDIPRETP